MDQSTQNMTQEVQPTMGKALKVWWAYTWRLILASFALMIPIQIVMVIFILPRLIPASEGEFPFAFFPIFMLLWFVMMVAMIALQVYFFKVVLKKEFSDFKTTLLKK